MRTLNDLEHFVLAPGETLILRFKVHLSNAELERVRADVERVLPNRPVLCLGPDAEVHAGMIEVMGQPEVAAASDDDITAQRAEIMAAYNAGKTIWMQDENDTEWFQIHRTANPHTFAWDHCNYSLHKPKL